MSEKFTIASLLENPGINTRLISGSDGLDRTVLWAHSCEMTDPGRWLGPHELLMTIGLCVPQGAQAQRDFIIKLDEAGLAGITIGDHGMMPRITNAMLAESDSRGFPVLITEPETPFAAIGRTIAAANADRQTMGVLLLAKLYQITGRRDLRDLKSGKELSDLFGTQITVFDEATSCVLVGEGLLANPKMRRHPLHTHRPAQLHLEDDSVLDGFALMHLAQVLSVDANAIMQETLKRINECKTVLELAISGHTEGYTSLQKLWGEKTVGFRAIVTTSPTPLQIPLAAALSGAPPTIIESADRIVIAVPSPDQKIIRQVLEQLGATAGCSAEHLDLADLSGAIAEATSEHFNAQERNETWREFSGNQVSLLARSRSEAEQIIESVLGPLATSEQRYVLLRTTLFAFLDNDMKWNVTAKDLHLHRQTLVYRLERVEQITKRSVRRTNDVSDFWLARSAWKLLHLSS